jgi:hypothetical protein
MADGYEVYGEISTEEALAMTPLEALEDPHYLGARRAVASHIAFLVNSGAIDATTIAEQCYQVNYGDGNRVAVSAQFDSSLTFPKIF